MGLFSSSSKSRTSTTSTAQTPQLYESSGASAHNFNEVYADDGARLRIDMTDPAAFALAGESVREMVRASDHARRDALMFAGESLVEQNEAIMAANDAGYTFAGEAASAAFGGIGRAQDAAVGLADRSRDAAFHGMHRAMDSVDAGRDAALTFAGESQAAGYGFVGEAFNAAMENVQINSDRLQETARQAASNIQENTAFAMDHVAAANRSEQSDFTSRFMLLAVGLVGFIAWRAT